MWNVNVDPSLGRFEPRTCLPLTVHKSCILSGPWYTSLVYTEPTAHDAIRVAAAAGDRLLRAEELGVPSSAMSRMEREGALARVVPGVYVGARWARHGLIEAAAWTLRYPDAVACLLTAAIHHGLTDAFARGTWLYVAKGSTVPRSRTSPLQIVQIAPAFIDLEHDDENGIATLPVHGVALRITDLDRTVLDLWRYPRRIPAEHALLALRHRARSEGFDVPRFARLARRLGIWPRVEPVLQGMMTR